MQESQVRFCLNLDTNFYFFHNYRDLHKTLSRPYVRPPATVIWVATWGWEPLAYTHTQERGQKHGTVHENLATCVCHSLTEDAESHYRTVPCLLTPSFLQARPLY
jgi:hypothetical protein